MQIGTVKPSSMMWDSATRMADDASFIKFGVLWSPGK